MKTKYFNIFKPGKHIDASGQTIAFSEADVEDIAKSYNPAIHEAPLCCGHPKDNKPAYGWVKELCYDNSGKFLKAMPKQVNPQFAEMVNSGAFNKVSTSLYSPESPANPNPGHYTLRHIAFLGAQPPAVKGLGSVSFAETDQADIELELDFAETALAYNDKGIARVLRNLKNFLIGKFSPEEAEEIIPEYALEEINSGAEQALQTPPSVEANPNFSEPEPAVKQPVEPETPKEDPALKAAEAKAQKLEAELAKAKAEKQAAENKEFCEKCVKEGRLLPTLKNDVLSFMDNLGGQELAFSEGEPSAVEAFKNILSSMPPVVNFSEVTPAAEDTPRDAGQIAAKALEFQEQQQKAGRVVRFSEAVRTVCK